MFARFARRTKPGLLTLACILGLAACTKNEEGQGRDKKGANGAQTSGRSGRGGRDSGPIAVKVEPANFNVVPRSVSVVAVLEGRSQADVYSKVTGRLSSIGPKEGEAVKAGSILFRVDRNDPGESFLNAPVVSPISGWIGRWVVTNVGSQVSATTPVVTVVDDEYLRVTVYLSTNEWVTIDEKAKVTVAIGEVVKPGRVVSVARAADSISGRGSAVVEVENKDHKWRVGMIARVQIDLEPKKRMLVSSAAVNITDQGSYVFVIVDNVAQKKKITFTVVDSDTVEILSGIEDNASVVIAGGNYLTDKAAVHIVDGEKKEEKAH